MLIIVSERPQAIQLLRDVLLRQGISSLSCPYETALFTCGRQDTGGVLIDGRWEPEMAEQLCKNLRERYPLLPIAVDLPERYCADLPADRLLRNAEEDLLTQVLDFCFQNCGFSPKGLSTYFLSMERGSGEIRYMGYPLPLSPVERRLLQVLIYFSPKTVSYDLLLSLCFPLGGGLSALSVHIYRINKTARSIDPRPLIVNQYGKGYRLREGIVEKEETR